MASHSKQFLRFEDDDELVLTETPPYRAYERMVIAEIKAADDEGDENYRGITQAELNRRLGDVANKDWTYMALPRINVFKTVQLQPRYSFIDKSVRYVDRHLIGTVAVPPKHKRDDPQTYPTAAMKRRFV